MWVNAKALAQEAKAHDDVRSERPFGFLYFKNENNRSKYLIILIKLLFRMT